MNTPQPNTPQLQQVPQGQRPQSQAQGQSQQEQQPQQHQQQPPQNTGRFQGGRGGRGRGGNYSYRNQNYNNQGNQGNYTPRVYNQQRYSNNNASRMVYGNMQQSVPNPPVSLNPAQLQQMSAPLVPIAPSAYNNCVEENAVQPALLPSPPNPNQMAITWQQSSLASANGLQSPSEPNSNLDLSTCCPTDRGINMSFSPPQMQMPIPCTNPYYAPFMPSMQGNGCYFMGPPPNPYFSPMPSQNCGYMPMGQMPFMGQNFPSVPFYSNPQVYVPPPPYICHLCRNPATECQEAGTMTESSVE